MIGRGWLFIAFAAAMGCGDGRLGRVYPALDPPPETADFGAVPVLNDKRISIPLLNLGRSELHVLSTKIVETSVPFRVMDAPVIVDSGDQGSVNLSFVPPSQADFSATLAVETDDPNFPSIEVKLHGIGSTQATLAIDPPVLDFGRVAEGTSAVQTLTVKSLGTANLLLESIDFSEGTSSAFSFIGSTRTPATVDDQIQLVVKYMVKAGASASATGAIHLHTTDPAQRDVNIPLKGSVNRAPVPQILALGNGALGMQVNLDGTQSSDPDGDLPLTYRWTLQQKPANSTTQITAPNQAVTQMQLDGATTGIYEVALEVTDAAGAKSLVPATAQVVALPDEKLRVEVFWDEELPDLDLHVTRSPSAPLGGPDDCYFQNRTPDWGVVGNATDDPDLIRDALTGLGPETFIYKNPVSATYRIHVVYVNDHDPSATTHGVTATVRVYEFGVLSGEYRRTFLAEGQIWDVADLIWPSGNLTPLP